MRYLNILAIVVLLVACINSQQLLFQSDSFTIFSNKVVQDQYEAIAESPIKISSSYRSVYKEPTRRKVDLKFSINGFDNENFPGQDHHVLLYPSNGKFLSPTFKFGDTDLVPQNSPQNLYDTYLEDDTDFTIRVDMRNVIESFKSRGNYTTYNGERIMADEFNGVYVAGGTNPLTWEFENLTKRPDLKLTDLDDDGIYEVTIRIRKYQAEESRENELLVWALQEDISKYPQFNTSKPLMNALYNKSLEEMIQNIREDSAFMAGAKWPGVWTRDISYSILLSLAIIDPSASKKSLMAKVNNNRIIQDTGTGGSWPISSDRMTWALAAWEIYTVTGDEDWLKYAYHVIKKSAKDDIVTIINPSTGMCYGESSFLDWREQTYPRWMDPKDIFKSQNLGTNVVHYQTYQILSKMAEILGEYHDSFKEIAGSIKTGVNKYLWMPEKGYYGQYLYGRNYLSVSPRSETLGEALAILFDVADEEQQKTIIQNTPVVQFGTPCIYPQIPNIPPYHNNGIWPFVEAYWTWASAKAKNVESVENGLASIYRASMLFLTNKENMVAQTGDYMGTEINSDRQLWSVAGNLAMIYRVFFGMSFTPDALYFNPFIPKAYNGTMTLREFNYRNAKLDITIKGYGSKIRSIKMDGEFVPDAVISYDLEGEHTLVIQMENNKMNASSINLVSTEFSPETPTVSLKKNVLSWEKIDGAKTYLIYRNGEEIGESTIEDFTLPKYEVYAEYQVLSVDEKGLQSFLSEPICIDQNENVIIIQSEEFGNNVQHKYSGFTGTGYIHLDKNENNELTYIQEIEQSGIYSIKFRYSNGQGPINTNNKCAVRTLLLDGVSVGVVVMPQQGQNVWDDWGYSNSISIELSKREHLFSLIFKDSNNNMNEKINSAFLDFVSLTLIAELD